MCWRASSKLRIVHLRCLAFAALFAECDTFCVSGGGVKAIGHRSLWALPSGLSAYPIVWVVVAEVVVAAVAVVMAAVPFTAPFPCRRRHRRRRQHVGWQEFII